MEMAQHWMNRCHTQYTYLLSGLETITFTAIGWLFGKEVHRQQAQPAERRAEMMPHMALDARQTADMEEMRGKMRGKGVMDHTHDPICSLSLQWSIHALRK